MADLQWNQTKPNQTKPDQTKSRKHGSPGVCLENKETDWELADQS